MLLRGAETTDVEQSEHRIPDIVKMGETIIRSLVGGGTLFTAGNGGSAAQALHLTEELIGRYKKTRPPIRSICLASEASAMTCIANDFGFDAVFERPLRGLARDGDVLLVPSTSGNSTNIITALTAARRCPPWPSADAGPAIERRDQSISDGLNSPRSRMPT